MTKTVSPFFPKRNLIQICLLGALAGPNLRHSSAEPVSLLKPTQKAKPMITIHTSTRVRSFLRVTAHVGIFIWLMLMSVSATAQVAGPAIAPSISEPSPDAWANASAQSTASRVYAPAALGDSEWAGLRNRAAHSGAGRVSLFRPKCTAGFAQFAGSR